MGKLTKEKQERQNMADNDERLRQKRNQAHKNSLRNQDHAIERPDRAKPKAKSEPIFKRAENIAETLQAIQNQNPPQPEGNDNPESKHEPKGPKGRPNNKQPKPSEPSIKHTFEKKQTAQT